MIDLEHSVPFLKKNLWQLGNNSRYLQHLLISPNNKMLILKKYMNYFATLLYIDTSPCIKCSDQMLL